MDADPATELERELIALGFTMGGASRRGGVVWTLAFNSYLEFHLHRYADALVMTWSYDLGEYLTDRGWVIGTGESSFHSMYPGKDVRIDVSMRAVEAEITRVLGQLRIDLGDPSL